MNRILVLSFSSIVRDARVLRQARVLAEIGQVTTCGHGEHPPGVAEHVQVPEELHSLPRTPAGVTMLAARQLRRAELAAPALRQALASLQGRTFDLVVANDARALPVAHRVAAGAPVWADMHEYAPEEFADDLRWRLLVKPLATHLCSRYLPAVAATTTVCQGIADTYNREFGVACEVVRNTPPYVHLDPSPIAPGRIRLVHSGSAVPGRQIDVLVRAAARLDERFTLDLLLVPGGDGGRFLRKLHTIASGHDRVRFLDPVAPDRLTSVLNAYDVGIYSLRPTNFNNRFALPNKFFDFIQARLALTIGPSPEMDRVVREHDLGLVAGGFDEASLVTALTTLDDNAIAGFKANAAAAARDLSFERDADVIRSLAGRLLGRARG